MEIGFDSSSPQKGNKTDVNNNHSISLLLASYKISFHLQKKHLRIESNSKIEKELEYQSEFRKFQSCAEQILSVKLIIPKAQAAAKHHVAMLVTKKTLYSTDQ